MRCLGALGRAAIVALSREALSFVPYTELINKEAQVIGVSDHRKPLTVAGFAERGYEAGMSERADGAFVYLAFEFRHQFGNRQSQFENAVSRRCASSISARRKTCPERREAESNGSTPPWMRSKDQPTTSGR